MNNLKIGQKVMVHGYVDEIRKDTVIIKNEGGYFGTVESEIEGQNGWIPVSERLPENREQTYLVYTDSDYMQICRWTNINHYWQGLTTEWHWHGVYSKVVAWMPLPEPYEEEKV